MKHRVTQARDLLMTQQSLVSQ